jgi:hypothetical protein
MAGQVMEFFKANREDEDEIRDFFAGLEARRRAIGDREDRKRERGAA